MSQCSENRESRASSEAKASCADALERLLMLVRSLAEGRCLDATHVDPVVCDELTLPVSRCDEIISRVLRFGAEAEVVGLEEFRELWKAEIGRMAEGFTKGRLT